MQRFDASHPYFYLMEVAFEDTIPLGWHVDLTYRCDLACVHCYLEDRKREELTLEEYEQFFADLAEAGCLYLLISGGDIFVRKDALDILWAAARHRFDMTLITHAMAIDDYTADQIAEMGIRLVATSVYHTDPEIHDRVTLREGSFERTIAGLRRLKERGVQISIKCPIFDINAGAEKTIPALAEELGAVLQLAPIIRGGNDGSDKLLSLNMDLDGKANVYDCLFSEWERLEAMPKFSAEQRTCLAGHASGYLSPDGTIQPCLDYERSAGNIREQRFSEIWKHSPLLNRLRGIRRKDFGGCNSCDNNSFCSLCPALADRETGDPTGSAPSKCRESTAIRYAFDRKEAEQEAEGFDLFDAFGLTSR
ncbi:MAG: radical SAM protein [Myxococcales bacterium]|nr:radical SAM protein [Myxococcales bacterium]